MANLKCPLCEREVDASDMQKHHMRTRRADKHYTEDLCRDCHKTLHGLFSNQDLRDPRQALDTIEGLMANDQFRNAISFIRKIPPGTYMRMRESKQRRK